MRKPRKFLLDLMVPKRLARWLEEQGHHVLTIPHGTPNRALLERAKAEGAIVVTAGRDFILLPEEFSDVKRVVFQASRMDWERLTRAFKELFEDILEALEKEALVVLKEKGFMLKVMPRGLVLEF